jgi:protoheme IX farnesyltransferase
MTIPIAPENPALARLSDPTEGQGEARTEAPSRWRDLVTLAKPRITAMNVLMTFGAACLAPGSMGVVTLLAALVGTALAVASANTLNMVWERNSDRLMKRTMARPLPSGRLPLSWAIAFGAGTGVASLAILALAVNVVTMALGAFAILAYAFVYTPLKRRTPLALLVGAVPGAMPPLMGWTAATGQIDAAGLSLFGILLVWQLPHFLAITLYLKNDYARAGVKTVPVVRGDRAAIVQAQIYAVLLLPVSLALVPLGVAGWLYGAAAIGLGVWYSAVGARGFRRGAGTRWARQFFFASLIYLPALIAALLVDASLGL